MELKDGIKIFYAKSQKDWRKWLAKNHEIEKSIWLLIYKKESGIPSVYYPEAVDEALCFGWIDSKANKKDDKSYYQYFAKRNPKSNWSKVNKDKVTKFIEQGIMAPAGMASINLAKENGTWNALDNVDQVLVPEDMQTLFNQNKTAFQNWQNFSRSTRRGILEWIQNAKQKETRMKRINETITLAEQNIKANQYIKKQNQ